MRMPRISQRYCCILPPLRLLISTTYLLPPIFHLFIATLCVLISAVCIYPPSYAQSATATLTGTVDDQNGALVAGANIALINAEQGSQRLTATNAEGAFVFALLPPGRYSLTVTREGFGPVELKDVVLNVNDAVTLRIHMNVGALTQTVQIVEGSTLINDSPTVSTVVERQFIENMPLNGRSVQSLITLTPGVVLTKSIFEEQGQFSVNGQRANANYFTIDGVSANTGINASGGLNQSGAGVLPSLTAAGGTNSLVSLDAMQEFKIQTSTYAPEFGRTPGAQIQIATRSGTNDFRGTLFEYFRNDALDANNWFSNRNRLPKAALRQNDFGFVFGGPILLPRFGEGGPVLGYNGRNRTFFFLSYEGLRLRQPQTATISVPSLASRQAAPVQLQPFLDAYPRPNGQTFSNGTANFVAAYSNPATLNATSIRIDHNVGSSLTFFGRYNIAPSKTEQRVNTLNNITNVSFRTMTFTVGATQAFSANAINELRLNYSRSEGEGRNHLDTFGGAVVPADSLLFPPFSSPETGSFLFQISGAPFYTIGRNAQNIQRQVNIVDNFSIVTTSHQLKFGVDYRYLSPIAGPREYAQTITFNGIGITAPGIAPPVGSVLSGTINSAIIVAADIVKIRFSNFSAYAQDTWKPSSRLTLTYGLRWEVNPPPTAKDGRDLFTATGLETPATIVLAPPGTPLWKTTYDNFAPRLGMAYQLRQQPGSETIIRGGFGIFYDLGQGLAGSTATSFPYSRRSQVARGTPFPLTLSQLTPPPFNPVPSAAIIAVAFDPNLKLPRTFQWNAALEQSLGPNETISASYVAAAGRRLLRKELLIAPNPSFTSVSITRNTATSDYHALQLQFERRLSQAIQALVSYTWSKSIDIASNDSGDNFPAARSNPEVDRGPSDFDIRHVFSAGVTYNIPFTKSGSFNAILRDWSIDGIFRTQTARPITVVYGRDIGFGFFSNIRPDVLTDVPAYIEDKIAPGGKRLNRAAFVIPAVPRQGSLGRNSLRGFPVSQMDLALRRQFRLTEQVNFQLRAEFFNIFNHPNFADPVTNLTDAQFGQATQMLSQSLGSGGAQGGFSPLYQIGGPRSLQFAFRLQF